MAKTHNLGFPRIGSRRELKFALEAYWKGNSNRDELLETARALRHRHWRQQAGLDLVPVGDFALYDQVLDMSRLFGNVPPRFRDGEDDPLNNDFRIARGRATPDSTPVSAGEMTKWFDTNYHYIVPEFDATTRFSLNAERLLEQLDEARALGVEPKPVLIGPVTYLWLGKRKDDGDRLDLLAPLLEVYGQLLHVLAGAGVEWVQIDEPILVTELDERWRHALRQAWNRLNGCGVKRLLSTYFGALRENLQLACELPADGVHIDAINAREEVERLLDWLPGHKVLSIGIINGRNIWKTDLNAALDWLEPIQKRLGDRLWLAPSCSLLHVPVDLDSETELDEEARNWLAFAVQKLDELQTLANALNQGREAVASKLESNAQAIRTRRESSRVHNPEVKQRVAAINTDMEQRRSPYPRREAIQSQHFGLPLYPTTTIGSFPQTAEIRHTRRRFRDGEIDARHYQQAMRAEIAHCIQEQEKLGLDVLVHGEPERNDMVEYFGQQLDGYLFTRFGWVQSYGSRCVKPPIILGDVRRPAPMTIDWIRYARSLTDKPVKGMLTGPVTMLNWSFARDDQPRSTTCLQLALAIRDEVRDLEANGIDIIQIDEAALREGLPLRRSEWPDYLEWAIRAFRIAANGVADETQIHTHMCYSEFNDIIEAIAAMDADVITIETSRSDMELLDVFDAFDYPNQIGPGVYDIHSPNIPDTTQIVDLMRKASQRIPAERLWINPDCGLKTRDWKEVRAALGNMIAARKVLVAGDPSA